jgi:hypothetical protein
MDTHRKNSAEVWYDILRIDDDQGSRQKIVMKDTEASRKKTHVLSYYHWECWPRTRRYYQISYYLMIKEGTIYLSIYSKQVFNYSLRGYSHRESWPRTRRYLYMYKESKEGERRLGQRHYSHREGVYINQG